MINSEDLLTPLGPDDDSWDEGVGWRIPGWGPPVGDLEFDCGGTRGILQDWYTLSSFLQIPEKLAIVSDMIRDKTDGARQRMCSSNHACQMRNLSSSSRTHQHPAIL
jgi:hypothetical protein